MSLDIQSKHLKVVQSILKEHIPEYSVIAFGSRIHGTATAVSDLDLCIMSQEPLSFLALAELRDAFSLSMIPYRVDISVWSDLSPQFQEIIKNKNVVIQEVGFRHD
jgi:predicted nucleotidyltransferase